MYRTDDPIADFDRFEAEQARELERLPICSECGERIQDDFCYVINDEIICTDCLDATYCKPTEDLMV